MSAPPRTRGIMETSKFGKEEKPYPHTEASRLSPLQSNPPAIRPSFHGLHAIARNWNSYHPRLDAETDDKIGDEVISLGSCIIA